MHYAAPDGDKVNFHKKWIQGRKYLIGNQPEKDFNQIAIKGIDKAGHPPCKLQLLCFSLWYGFLSNPRKTPQFHFSVPLNRRGDRTPSIRLTCKT